MAGVGVIIRNYPDRLIVIDSNYKNQAMRSYAALTINSPILGYHQQNFSVNCSPSATIAFRCNSWLLVRSQTQSGNTRTLDIVSQVAQTFEIYVFDEPGLLSSSPGPGMRIRNRVTGELVFDSRNKYLKVKGFFPTGQNLSLSGVRKPAMIPTQAQFEHTEEVIGAGTGGYDVIVSEIGTFCRTLNGIAESRSIIYFDAVESSGSTEVYSYSSGSASYLVIDVEDY